MAGPYPPYPPVGGEGQPQPGPQAYPNFPYPAPNTYPGPLPPPVDYPAPGRKPRARWWILAALAVIAALVGAAAAFNGLRGPSGFSDSAVKSAIQSYLTALSGDDTETIARNTACGIFDAVKDRKADLALAGLVSDAFRKQFDSAEVTSIDKVVLSSPYQAQVLFTMRVEPAPGSRSAHDEMQAVAQVLRQDGRLLVCSYLQRTAAQY